MAGEKPSLIGNQGETMGRSTVAPDAGSLNQGGPTEVLV